jgi:hypothetical protein
MALFQRAVTEAHHCEQVNVCLCRSGVHLPNEYLGVVDGGDALAADTGESHGVAFVEGACAFEIDDAACYENVGVGRIGHAHGVGWL